MKTISKHLCKFLVPMLLLFITGCSKDDSSTTMPPDTDMNTGPDTELEETQSNVDPAEYETDEGQLGVGVSARSLRRKGYAPTKAILTINEGSKAGDYEENLGEETLLALFSFENETLTDDDESTLKDGVAISITIENEVGEELAIYTSSKYSFSSSPNEIEVDDPTKPDINPIVLNPTIDYYMQILDEDITSVFGAPSATLRTSTTVTNTEVKVRDASGLDYINDTQQTIPFTKYRFETVDAQNNVFNIYNPNGSKKHYLYMDSNNRLNVQSEANISQNGGNTPDAATRTNYQFKIEKVDTGRFLIIPMWTGIPLIASQSLKSITSQVTETPSYFRILNFEIDWEITSIETKFLSPILPPSRTVAAFNKALRNCSSGTLTDEVGINQTETRTDTYTWSESIQLATSIEASLSSTITSKVETSVNAKFFGASSSVEASVTAGLSVGHSTTETRTESSQATTSQTIEVASKRTLTVPSGRGTTAADIYQEYRDVKVPYVQKFRVRGNYKEGTKLYAPEILSQFNFNGFSGVIVSTVDDQLDYIDITLRGTTVISHLIETETVTRDIPNACGG